MDTLKTCFSVEGSLQGKSNSPKNIQRTSGWYCIRKILVIIILNRLKDWYDQTLLDQQQRFRSGRGTSDGIFITKRIQQITDSMKKAVKKAVFIFFVDLSAAFDQIVRSWLFKSIHQRLAPNKGNTLFRILDQKNQKIFLSPEFPPLYNIFMDYVMRVYEHEYAKENVQFIKLKYRIAHEKKECQDIMVTI